MKQETRSSLSIRSLDHVEELGAVYQLETRIWSVEDAVPVNHTAAAVKNGGFVLGAFIRNELIGFQYSFPGFDGNKVYLCSHSLGIDSKYRAFGVGEMLKNAQKVKALEKGYDLISWTYDPLETVNANLNLHKLGAVCTRYIENAYGEMSDHMNAGIPTDRFLVEWRIKNEKPRCSQSAYPQMPCVIETDVENGFSIPYKTNLNYSNDKLLVPVPGNYQDIKKQNFSLALKWREATKNVFIHFLRDGWTVTDLIKDRMKENQYLYLLEKE
ncbi:GNAT family N-acetyltransferase [Cytobacillus sp. NCCP-133]|uniref:GNAT family N-acetyltransferase n=1 Tax=Cytobacillus sp. NCCP-133 TaxID=766848 RepID=UPI00222E7B6A|nr:GNAT family N-acetyltransferase [Cytobacillus sp. NCCP-133]GLB58957.1 chorismate synthase [Cytobacillus sp. NCCP-133]